MNIEVDDEVYMKLKELADPFIDTTPNHALRRLLGLNPKLLSLQKEEGDSTQIKEKLTIRMGIPLSKAISKLREGSPLVHPSFLTFLMDKHLNAKGNYNTSDIIPFFERFHLVTPAGSYWNPWMDNPYKNKDSCQRTIEHYRQCRKFGCWGGKDSKENCQKFSCEYHPNNKDGPKNKCDLRNGVIWKREEPKYPSCYGNNYMELVKKDLLRNKSIPLFPLLSLFYPEDDFNEELIKKFKADFNLNEKEMAQFFTY